MAEFYHDRYSEMNIQIESLMVQTKLSETLVMKKKKIKLLKIEMKKFYEDIKNYLDFLSQFKKIHLDKTSPDEDKFWYLISAIVSQ